MKKYVLTAATLLVALISCNKENQTEIRPEESPLNLVPMTFQTVLPDTRTTVDGVHVLWSSTDKLNVIEVDGNNIIAEHEFSYVSGEGKGSAVFSGEVNSTSNTFYAVYPNQKLFNSPSTLGSTLELKTLGQSAVAVENSFDPAMAVMTAVADASGNLVFRHAMAYLKFTANSADIVSVKVTSKGDARIYGRPVINIEDGSPNAVNGTGSNSNITLSGSFVSGSSYMIPITIKPDKKLGELAFLATDVNGIVSEVSTASMSNVKPAAGHVYNLGTIPFSFVPTITFTAPDKLEYDATSGAFSYAVVNPVTGQSVTATLESGVNWISNIVVGADAVTFTCSKNNAADAQERSAVITLHYTGAADVPVTVTQGIAGSIVEEHDWYFTDYTDAQMKAITGLEADAKATAGQTWNFGDGLTMVTNSSSKWNKQTIGGIEYKWVATGGKYGSNQKYFSFTTGSAGTVTVLYASGGSASRALTLKDGSTETTDNANVSTGTSDLKTVTFASVAAGTVLLYSKDDNVRIFRITFHGNS